MGVVLYRGNQILFGMGRWEALAMQGSVPPASARHVRPIFSLK